MKLLCTVFLDRKPPHFNLIFARFSIWRAWAGRALLVGKGHARNGNRGRHGTSGGEGVTAWVTSEGLTTTTSIEV